MTWLAMLQALEPAARTANEGASASADNAEPDAVSRGSDEESDVTLGGKIPCARSRFSEKRLRQNARYSGFQNIALQNERSQGLS
jgi:hypothetical protein